MAEVEDGYVKPKETSYEPAKKKSVKPQGFGQVVSGIFSDINKDRKKAGIGVHSGGKIGGKHFGVDVRKSLNTFFPIRSRLYNYGELSDPRRPKRDKAYQTQVTTKTKRGGKEVITTKVYQHNPTKSKPRQTPQSRGIAPIGFGLGFSPKQQKQSQQKRRSWADYL